MVVGLANALIARTWAERAQAELGASRRFGSLAGRLQQSDAHPAIIQLATKAEHDEDRHAYLCSTIALKWGHDTGFAHPQGTRAELQVSWQDRPEVEILLLDVVLMCCVTESFNASLLQTLYARCERNEEGQLIHQILKDEVKHAQIGWAHLQYESQRRDCGFVSQYLTEMLDLAVRDELFAPIVSPVTTESYAFGVMPHSDRLLQFRTTLQEVILPGFAHVGIDASSVQHWLEAKER